MTELMPDVLMSGMEARRQAEEKKKVEGLREELADVVRAEHDVGLRLHRALKRRDRNDIYEPTGLWVRRVTGWWGVWEVLDIEMLLWRGLVLLDYLERSKL
jgi:hypothetical protein